MFRLLNYIQLFFLSLFSVANANEVEVENKILKSENDVYHISTTITCKENSGILRLSISVPDEYEFKLYNDPNLLIDNRNNTIKFYTNFEPGNTIEIHFRLNKKSKETIEAAIPTHTEYTIDGIMKMIDKEIVLSSNETIPIQQMDSISEYHEEKSKQAEIAMLPEKTKTLPVNAPPSKEKIKNEESLSMPAGYNSSTSSGFDSGNKSYSVQILSLQFFNEKRLIEFLNAYNIKQSETYKKEINGVVKIYIGKYKSYDEAKALKEKLIRENRLTDSFIVSY